MSLCKTISKAATVLSWLSEHALNIFTLSDMFFLTLVSGVSSSTSWPIAMAPVLAVLTRLSQKWTAKSFFSAQASVSRSCSSAFSSTDLEQIFALMWQRSWKRSAGLSFLYLSFYSGVAPCALSSIVNCVRTFWQELHCRFPADILRNWILWDARSLGTVKAGILLGGTLPLLHHHLKRLIKESEH